MTADEIRLKLKEWLATDEATNIKTIVAYSIKKTPTLTDDEIIANSADVADVIAEELSDVSEMNPTNKEGIKAAVDLIKNFAENNNKKVLLRVVKFLDIFV